MVAKVVPIPPFFARGAWIVLINFGLRIQLGEETDSRNEILSTWNEIFITINEIFITINEIFRTINE
jgi:hypothetical protein